MTYPLKLKFVPKTALWGGSTLKNSWNKPCDLEKLAETWELTVRDDAVNIIENGEIRAYSTTYRSFGAGVQTALEGDQKMTYDDDGNMIITGFDITYDPLRYIVGTVSDHILTFGGEEISLRDTCGRNAKVVFEVADGFEILTKGK